VLSEIVEALLDQHADHPAVGDGGLPQPGRVRGVHISHRWLGRLVVLLFRERDRSPWLLVKVDRHPPYFARLAREEATLRTLEGRPDLDGLVPRPVGALQLDGDARAFVQTGLPGSPLTTLVRRRMIQHPWTWARDHERIRGWFDRLASWNPRADGTVLDVADGLERLSVAVEGADGSTRRWLDRARVQAERLPPVHLPAVRGHGDLGPSNLLVHRGRTRLVDWEGGLEHRSPLPEAVLFLHHYARAVPLPSRRMPTREEAIVRAFAADEPLGRCTRRAWDQLLDDHGIDPSVADLVLLSTLGTLAAGEAGTAHSARARRMWARSATHLVTELASGAHPSPAAR
jgi:hypothetical protein